MSLGSLYHCNFLHSTLNVASVQKKCAKCFGEVNIQIKNPQHIQTQELDSKMKDTHTHTHIHVIPQIY